MIIINYYYYYYYYCHFNYYYYNYYRCYCCRCRFLGSVYCCVCFSVSTFRLLLMFNFFLCSIMLLFLLQALLSFMLQIVRSLVLLYLSKSTQDSMLFPFPLYTPPASVTEGLNSFTCTIILKIGFHFHTFRFLSHNAFKRVERKPSYSTERKMIRS